MPSKKARNSTKTSSKAPKLTALNRVFSIPLVASSIEKVDGTLTSNPYTRSSYSTAKGFSDAAFRFSEPLQVQLAPLFSRADLYANKAVDFVEARYPFPMKATPDEVYGWVRETQQSCTTYASRTIDERVKNPAIHVAQGIDKSFAPIVDIFEDAVHRFGSNPNSPISETHGDSRSQYQYQRALSLSKTLKDEIQLYSNQQFKDLQNHSALVHRSVETAQAVVSAANSSVALAQAHVHALSDNMIAQVQKLQCQLQELSGTLQSSAVAAYHNSSQQIPELQKSLRDLSSELHNIMIAKDETIQEKASRAGNQVKERVAPLLETMKRNISEFLEKARSRDQTEKKPPQNGH
ncbi:lipid droplet-associated perilipin protein [Marasmius fiardii PR-910]|nr:lipid droplet-associated perilipin protein [Marasmius fiardii PR-910]